MSKSLLDEFKKFQESLNSDEFTPHLVIGMDLTKSCEANSAVLMSKGSHFEIIGMIDVVLSNIKHLKRELIKQNSIPKSNVKDKREASDTEAIIQRLPPEIREKVIAFKKRMDDAMEKGDVDELAKIKKEMTNMSPFGEGNDLEKDEDTFDLNDFK